MKDKHETETQGYFENLVDSTFYMNFDECKTQQQHSNEKKAKTHQNIMN